MANRRISLRLKEKNQPKLDDLSISSKTSKVASAVPFTMTLRSRSTKNTRIQKQQSANHNKNTPKTRRKPNPPTQTQQVSNESNTNDNKNNTDQRLADQPNILHELMQIQNLRNQLKKATVKFDKACRQLVMLDQQMNDLQYSYTNSLENDRKTFKIVYRMQLATLEGTHNAYIEYIERQVEKIKKLKQMLFTDINNDLSYHGSTLAQHHS